MIVKPRIRGFICTTAHPAGLRASVQQQIEHVRQDGTVGDGSVGNVLVVGCSAGYGLASRISAAFSASSGSPFQSLRDTLKRPADAVDAVTSAPQDLG